MSTLTASGDDVLVISEEPAPRRRNGRRFRIAWKVGAAGVALLAALSIPQGISSAVRARQRSQCFLQLEQLGKAFQDYQETHGHLPVPALVRRDGTPL